MDFRLPEQLARDWNVKSTIGHGGNSNTYLLKETAPGSHQEMVLKCRANADPASAERFRRELELLRKIDHPNVIKVLLSDDDEPPGWFTMPRGNKFDKWWRKRRSKLSGDPQRLFRESVTVVLGLLDGLCEFHKADYTHRDVKPDNIVVIKNNAVLIDLGIVHHAELEGLTGPSGAGNDFVRVSRSIPPSPKLDNLCLASLWIQMLLKDPRQSYGHYDWRYVDLISGEWPYTIPISILAVCSGMERAPVNACELKERIKGLLSLAAITTEPPPEETIARINLANAKAAVIHLQTEEQARESAQAMAISARDAAFTIGSSIKSYVEGLAEKGLTIEARNVTTEGPPFVADLAKFDWTKELASVFTGKGEYHVVHVHGGTRVNRGLTKEYNVTINVRKQPERSPGDIAFLVRARGPATGEKDTTCELTQLRNLRLLLTGGVLPGVDAGKELSVEDAIGLIEKLILDTASAAAGSSQTGTE